MTAIPTLPPSPPKTPEPSVKNTGQADRTVVVIQNNPPSPPSSSAGIEPVSKKLQAANSKQPIEADILTGKTITTGEPNYTVIEVKTQSGHVVNVHNTGARLWELPGKDL